MSELRDIILMFFIFGGGFWVLSPIARAVAKRIGSPSPSPADPDALAELRDEMRHVREEMAQLAERVDFAERALIQQRAQQIGRPTDARTPV